LPRGGIRRQFKYTRKKGTKKMRRASISIHHEKGELRKGLARERGRGIREGGMKPRTLEPTSYAGLKGNESFSDSF